MKKKTILVLTKAAYLSCHPPTPPSTRCAFFVYSQTLTSILFTRRKAREQRETQSFQRNGLSQIPLRTLWLQISSPHSRSDVASRKVSTARAYCLPPHSILSKYTIGAGPSPFSIHLKTFKKRNSTCLITISTHHSCLPYKMKSSSDLHSRYLASTP